ncbi:hypothetical protein AC249_AIPGENE28931 [Exaiptasia diaphana]|nr:hypothetical protein AC249_AIPGENE28931 [Exaiptasia diaphana]
MGFKIDLKLVFLALVVLCLVLEAESWSRRSGRSRSVSRGRSWRGGSRRFRSVSRRFRSNQEAGRETVQENQESCQALQKVSHTRHRYW